MSAQQIFRLWCDDDGNPTGAVDAVEACQAMFTAGLSTIAGTREVARDVGWTMHVVQPGATIVDYCPACSARRAKSGQLP